MKRKKAILLTAALLSLSLIFSGAAYASSDAGDQNSQAPDPDRTLWDKTISPTMLQVPGDIFADGETSIAAMSADGTTVLLNRVNQLPCLADVESGEITQLQPAAPWVEEWMREGLIEAGPDELKDAAQELSEDQIQELIQEFTQEITDLSGQALLEKYLDIGRSGHMISAFPMVMEVSDYICIISNRRGTVLAVSCKEGTAGLVYGPFQNTVSIRDQTAAVTSNADGVSLVNLETGEKTGMSFGEFDMFPDGYDVTAVRILADGRYCATLRARSKRMNENAFLLENEQGGYDLISLGIYMFGKSPCDIMVLGNNRFLLFNRMVIMGTGTILIDGNEQKSFLLIGDPNVDETNAGEGILTAWPLEEQLDENREPVVPEDSTGFLPLMPMADGKTVMFQLMGYAGLYTLFNTEIMLGRPIILSDGTPASLPATMNISGNGYDRFVINFVNMNAPQLFFQNEPGMTEEALARSFLGLEVE